MRGLIVILLLALGASPALAQLTVVTDQAAYTAGEMVQIVIHNAGPSVATFVSEPAYSIWHAESGDCVFGCVGLPVIWTLPVGATINTGRDTGAAPDLVGHYEIALSGSSDDPGSVLSAAYELQAPVPTTGSTWGDLKSLFR